MTRPIRLTRADLSVFRPLTTRWKDNDVFGHVNNVEYYSWFDTAVTGWYLDNAFVDPVTIAIIPYVVESGCTYHAGISFPDAVDVGIAVVRLGTSSVTFRIGVFRAGEDLAAAQGHFSHVFVDRATQRPQPIPSAIRTAMQGIMRG
jgi:acyl-CoA thioester hydrolase